MAENDNGGALPEGQGEAVNDSDTPERVLTPEQAEAFHTLGDPGKKALADERRARKVAEKEREALAARIREFEEKGLSEQEKLARTAEEAQARATQAEERLMRLEVAQEKGLTANQAKYLSGATRQELEARAEEILADFPTAPGFVPLFDQGARGSGAGQSDMNSMIRRAAGVA